MDDTTKLKPNHLDRHLVAGCSTGHNIKLRTQSTRQTAVSLILSNSTYTGVSWEFIFLKVRLQSDAINSGSDIMIDS